MASTLQDDKRQSSREWFERASEVLIEGASAPSRGPRSYTPYPAYITSGKGSRIFDADGRELVDLSLAYGSNTLGHAHPEIVDAVCRGVANGIHFGAAIPEEVELAELVTTLCPVDVVRFVPSGNEACMGGIRLARAYTGRDKVIKFEGHFHGWADTTVVSVDPHSPSDLGQSDCPNPILDATGVLQSAVENTIVVPWNDEAAIQRVMADCGKEIACIITESIMANIGVIPPKANYLRLLQSLCKEYGALFFLDETVTGFRLAPGGCAELYGLAPDLISYGKALGHGFPLAAIGGRRDVMNGLKQGKIMNGTFNACRLPVCASLAGMQVLCEKNLRGFSKLNETGEVLAERITQAIEGQTRHNAIVQGVGAIFQILFTDKSSIETYREYCRFVDEDKFKRFANIVRDLGVFMNPVNSLKQTCSIAHTDEDANFVADAVAKALERLEN